MEVIIKKPTNVYIMLEIEVLICTLNLFTVMIKLSRMIKMRVTYHTLINNLTLLTPMVIIQIDIDKPDKRKIEA